MDGVAKRRRKKILHFKAIKRAVEKDTPTNMNKLTPPESLRLKQLEQIVKKGLDTFVEVGAALKEIQDKKLYRAEYESFEKYCRAEWGKSYGWAWRMIESSDVQKTLPSVKVPNEATARELAKIPPARRSSVAQKAVADSGKLSAPAVRKAAIPPPKSAKQPEDGTGFPIPKEILPLWNRGEEIQALLTGISRIKGILKKAHEEKDKLFCEVDFNDCVAKLSTTFESIKSAKPFAVCPDCNGVTFKNCSGCGGRGFVSEFFWKNCVPVEKRELRD